MGLETLVTVDRLIAAWAEGNFRRLTAFGANYFKELARTVRAARLSIFATRFVGPSTARATAGIALKTFRSVKLLLACGKGKSRPTIATSQFFI